MSCPIQWVLEYGIVDASRGMEGKGRETAAIGTMNEITGCHHNDQERDLERGWMVGWMVVIKGEIHTLALLDVVVVIPVE